jgi:hypothetical protein
LYERHFCRTPNEKTLIFQYSTVFKRGQCNSIGTTNTRPEQQDMRVFLEQTTAIRGKNATKSGSKRTFCRFSAIFCFVPFAWPEQGARD